MPRQGSPSTAPLQDRPAVVELVHCKRRGKTRGLTATSGRCAPEPGLVVQPRERRV